MTAQMRVLTFLLASAGAVANAQEPRPNVLAGTAERLSTAFTSVDALEELRDGRVIVVDGRERSVSIGDFATQRVATVSRRGSGPVEYLQPRRVFRLPDGGLLVSDPANARFLRLAPDGRELGPWQAVNGRGRQNTMTNLSAAWDARAVDARGRLYYELLPGPLRAGQSVSVPILRMDPDAKSVDTVAGYTMTPEMQTRVASEGGRGVAIIRSRAWPSRPEWAVAPNGTVALVHPAPYRLSLITNGRQQDGPPVTVPPVRVTEADRSAFTDAESRVPRGPSSPAGSEPPRPAGTPPPTRKQGGAPLFPDVMPPFSGRDAVHAAPDGRVWVSRSGHATDTVQVIDVFGANGQLEERIALPPRRRLLSFSESRVYLVYRDADDLEYVERYLRPRR